MFQNTIWNGKYGQRQQRFEKNQVKTKIIKIKLQFNFSKLDNVKERIKEPEDIPEIIQNATKEDR